MSGYWLRSESTSLPLDDFYFERDDVTRSLLAAVESRKHVLLYGLPRQGKTTVVRRALAAREAITLHCSEEFGFIDIARNLLLALGCSVTTEQKKRLKASAKAEVKFTWPFVSAGGAAEGGAEREETLRTFTAEIGNPNDVCHLLKQLGTVPLIILEHFERLGKKDRRLILEFLQITAENGAAQLILIASAVDMPLDYRERLSLSRYLRAIELPLMSRDVNTEFMIAALKRLGCAYSPDIVEATYERLGGSLEPTLEVCSLIGSRSESHGLQAVSADGREGTAYLSAEFQQRSRTYLLALVSAIVEAAWTISCSRRVPVDVALRSTTVHSDGSTDADEADSETDPSEIAILDVLRSDSEYRQLRIAVARHADMQAPADLPPAARRLLAPTYKAAVQLGKSLLQCPIPSDTARHLAFAVRAFIQEPVSEFSETYVPAYEDEELDVNLGIVICTTLLASDLSERVVLTRDVLARYLAERNLVHMTRPYKELPIPKLARRLRRLQRALQVEPPLFTANQNQTEIVLWDPRNLSVFGDIKVDLAALLDEANEVYGGWHFLLQPGEAA